MKPLSRRIYALAALALAAVIFVCVNIVADAWITTAKLDLTENGQFTLSQGTRDVLAKIPEPITLKFYYSKKLATDYAQVAAYAGRVRDLLGQYVSLSHGKIVLQQIDPEPLSEVEDQASGAGLTGLPTDGGDAVYFGLVGSNRIDGKEVIPFFTNGRDINDREPRLEYDLTALVDRLSHPRKPVLGILAGLPLDGGGGGIQAAMSGGGQPYAIYSALTQSYDTQMLDPAANRIPPSISVLMIVHPANLSAAALYAIDQFVLSGGKALIFVDPNAELAQAASGMDPRSAPPASSDLPRLFQAWGVGYSPARVVVDRALAQRVQLSSDPRNGVASYPVWLALTNANFDGGDIVTASLKSLNLASAGALHPLKGATTKFAPLVRSSGEAALLDTQAVRFNPRPQDLMSLINPTGEQYVIAARVSGPARTAFGAGAPAAMTTAGQPAPAPLPPQLKESAGPINVIVMADSDIFDDRFWVHIENGAGGSRVATPVADNGAFVLNAVENLMGSSDLISLRTRATNDRPFTVVKDMEAKAQEAYQTELDGLQTTLQAAQQRLHELQQGASVNGQPVTAAGLSQAQQAEIDRVRKEVADTRRRLRDLLHRQREDVDRLGSELAFVNIALVPLLLVGFALVQAWRKRRRRARALTA